MSKFYWPRLAKDVEQYVKTCPICQQVSTPRFQNKAEMIPILQTRPFELVTSDIMGPLRPASKSGNRYILILSDHFTKCVEIFPLKTQQKLEVAKCIT